MTARGRRGPHSKGNRGGEAARGGRRGERARESRTGECFDSSVGSSQTFRTRLGQCRGLRVAARVSRPVFRGNGLCSVPSFSRTARIVGTAPLGSTGSRKNIQHRKKLVAAEGGPGEGRNPYFSSRIVSSGSPPPDDGRGDALPRLRCSTPRPVFGAPASTTTLPFGSNTSLVPGHRNLGWSRSSA